MLCLYFNLCHLELTRMCFHLLLSYHWTRVHSEMLRWWCRRWWNLSGAVINWGWKAEVAEHKWNTTKICQTRKDMSQLSPSSSSASFAQSSPSWNCRPIRVGCETLSVCQPPKAFQKSPRTDSVSGMCVSVCVCVCVCVRARVCVCVPASHCHQLLPDLTTSHSFTARTQDSVTLY